MKRVDVEKMANKVGLTIRKTDGMQRAKNDGAKWAVGQPGWQPKHFFYTLEELYDYLSIEKGGQDID